MKSTSKIEADIGYVKNLLSKSDSSGLFPPSICILWAIVSAAGFSLVDLAPKLVGFFWMIAGPAGGLLSGYLGWRAGADKGQLDRETGIRHGLHWGGMLAFIAMAVILGAKGVLQGTVLSQVILLIVAFGWWTAGVHFDKTFLYLAGVMILGFAGTLLFSKYVWTAMGILMGVVLTAVAVHRSEKNVTQPE